MKLLCPNCKTEYETKPMCKIPNCKSFVESKGRNSLGKQKVRKFCKKHGIEDLIIK